jgi:hypothetical protein
LLIRKEFHFRVKFANVDSGRFERHRMTQQTDIAIYQSTDDPHQFAFTRSDQPAADRADSMHRIDIRYAER